MSIESSLTNVLDEVAHADHDAFHIQFVGIVDGRRNPISATKIYRHTCVNTDNRLELPIFEIPVEFRILSSRQGDRFHKQSKSPAVNL